VYVIIKTIIIDPTEDVQSQGQEVHLEKERSVEVGQEVQEGGLDQGRKEGLRNFCSVHGEITSIRLYTPCNYAIVCTI
jgi:hypothetical protein